MAPWNPRSTPPERRPAHERGPVGRDDDDRYGSQSRRREVTGRDDQRYARGQGASRDRDWSSTLGQQDERWQGRRESGNAQQTWNPRYGDERRPAPRDDDQRLRDDRGRDDHRDPRPSRGPDDRHARREHRGGPDPRMREPARDDRRAHPDDQRWRDRRDPAGWTGRARDERDDRAYDDRPYDDRAYDDRLRDDRRPSDRRFDERPRFGAARDDGRSRVERPFERGDRGAYGDDRRARAARGSEGYGQRPAPGATARPAGPRGPTFRDLDTLRQLGERDDRPYGRGGAPYPGGARDDDPADDRDAGRGWDRGDGRDLLEEDDRPGDEEVRARLRHLRGDDRPDRVDLDHDDRAGRVWPGLGGRPRDDDAPRGVPLGRLGPRRT